MREADRAHRGGHARRGRRACARRRDGAGRLPAPLRSLIAAARHPTTLGTLYSLRITARDAEPAEDHYIPGSGGIFRDIRVHDFDLTRWITGREVATVYAIGAVRGFERFARHGDVDTSAIALTMDDGMPVLIDGSRHDPRGYDVRLELLGSEDALVVGLDGRTPLTRLGAPPPAAPWSSFAERFADAFARETAAFVELVRDGGESPCPPESALEALRVAVACDISRAEATPGRHRRGDLTARRLDPRRPARTPRRRSGPPRRPHAHRAARGDLPMRAGRTLQ